MNFLSSFLAPAMFAFLALIPLVILMYLLKLKRRNVLISSTILWARSIQDLSANQPFQKLRRNLLLLLQILILLFLIFALARPFMKLSDTLEGRIILLMDTSASMQATDVEPSRMAKAKEEALNLVSNMPSNGLMSVISFASKPHTEQPFTSNKDELRRSIESLEATDTETNIEGALRLALQLLQTQQDARIHIISDGALEDLPELVLGEEQLRESLAGLVPGGTGTVEPVLGEVSRRVSLQAVGSSSSNLGITEADVREAPGRPLEKEVFVLVENTGTAPAEGQLVLYEDEELIDAKAVDLEPGASTGFIFSNLDIASGVARVELKSDDPFQADNEAWVVLRQRDKARVLLVSTENIFLEAALARMNIIDASKVAPVEYVPSDVYDLVIFDTYEPEGLGRGSYLFWNSIPPVPGVEYVEEIEQPVIIDWHRTHPINRFLRLDNFLVRSAMHINWPREAEVLLEAREAPLITALEKDDRRIVTVAFDAYNSTWPQRSVSFPIFVNNAILWLIGAESQERRDMFKTGDTIPLVTDDVSATFTITHPDGEEETLVAESNRAAYFTRTQEKGLYTIEQAGKPESRRRIAVNLLSQSESTIGARESVLVGNDPVQVEREEIRRDKELWPLLAILGFVVLIVEWFIYSRRVWI